MWMDADVEYVGSVGDRVVVLWATGVDWNRASIVGDTLIGLELRLMIYLRSG